MPDKVHIGGEIVHAATAAARLQDVAGQPRRVAGLPEILPEFAHPVVNIDLDLKKVHLENLKVLVK